MIILIKKSHAEGGDIMTTWNNLSWYYQPLISQKTNIRTHFLWTDTEVGLFIENYSINSEILSRIQR